MTPAHASLIAADGAPAMPDCWRRIGVQGDKSCPELATHVHCRNCPVYAEAAHGLLDRAPSAESLAEWTRHFARVPPPVRARLRSVLIFRLGAEWHALPVATIKEITPVRPVHTLPHRNDGLVAGVVNVRGELIICMALDRLLGVEAVTEPESSAQTLVCPRLVVLRHQRDQLAFRADEIYGLERYGPEDLQAVPATVARGAAAHTTAMFPWRKRSVGCLDEARIFATLNRSLA